MMNSNFLKDPVKIRFLGQSASTRRGQGRRTGGGMVTGAMSTIGILEIDYTWIETTMAVLIKHIGNHCGHNLQVVYHGYQLTIEKRDYDAFFEDPRLFAFKDFKKRLALAG